MFFGHALTTLTLSLLPVTYIYTNTGAAGFLNNERSDPRYEASRMLIWDRKNPRSEATSSKRVNTQPLAEIVLKSTQMGEV